MKKNVVTWLHSKYVCFAEINLIGLVLLAFAKEEVLEDSIREISVKRVKTGSVSNLMGLKNWRLGNKGGVILWFWMHDSVYLFANCHLSAHQNNVKDRLRDMRRIRSHGFDEADSSEAPSAAFIMGDLNFRLNMERHDAEDMINSVLHTQSKTNPTDIEAERAAIANTLTHHD